MDFYEEEKFKLLHYRKFALTLNNPAFRLRNKAVRMNIFCYHIIKSGKKETYICLKKIEALSILIQRHFDIYAETYNNIKEDYIKGIVPDRIHQYECYNMDNDYDYVIRNVFHSGSSGYIITHKRDETIPSAYLGKTLYRVIELEFIEKEIENRLRDEMTICEFPVAEMMPFLKDEILYSLTEKDPIFLKETDYVMDTCPICIESWSEHTTQLIIPSCCHSICKDCYNKLKNKCCPICRIEITTKTEELRSIEELEDMIQHECPIYICDYWFDELESFAHYLAECWDLNKIFDLDYEFKIDYCDEKYREIKKIAKISSHFEVSVLCS